MLISSILVKKNPSLTSNVCRVNDMLRDLCEKNGFSCTCNNVVTIDYLLKDGVHLQDMEARIFSNLFLKFLNNSILSNLFLKFLNNSIGSKFDNHLSLNYSPQTGDAVSDIKSLIDLFLITHYFPL